MSLGKKRSTETKEEVKLRLIKKVANFDEFYRDGSPKSATAILVEVIAIIREA